MRLSLAFSICALIAWTASQADEPALVLRKDANLRGSAAAGGSGPLYLGAERIETVAPEVIEASGAVEARRAGQNLYADSLRYHHDREEIEAQGRVRLEQAGLVLTGDRLKLRLDDDTGFLTHPRYRILPTATRRFEARGEADVLEMLGQDRFKAREASYTTCPAGNDDWLLEVADLTIDQDRQVGTARNVLLSFKDVPLLYTPWADFPLNDARKSGFLAPTLGLSDKSGLDLTLPYYFNLAPNYDATLYPRILSRRGLQLGGEFRYLMPAYRGVSALEYLPDDQVAGRSRWLVSLNHTHTLTPRLGGQLNFERVSDDGYFRDLSNRIDVTSRSILPQEGVLNYQGDGWQAGLRAQKLQVLQDPNLPPITSLYDRLPQFTLSANRAVAGLLQAELQSEYTYFRHATQPDPLTQVDGGQRLILYPTLSLPYTSSAFSLTPKVGYHYTRYRIDEPLPGMPEEQSRSLPIASVDGRVVFERDFGFRNERYVQTLEPRAYYVYAPYRDQSRIPVFDTAPLDFSFAQIFSENQFIGGDRINDANQLTLALASRFLEQDSGVERLKLMFGQRYYFSSQKVTLPGMPPRDRNTTDLLAALSGQISQAWRVDAGWQFDTDLGKTIRNTLSASYRPAPGRTVNMGYRFIDGSVEQLNTALQWPLSPRLYGLLRLNYSLRDSSLVEGLAGLEYNGGCWVLRAVVQRIAIAERDASNSFFIQLELNGMGRLGASPLSVLKDSIPGYRPINEFHTQ